MLFIRWYVVPKIISPKRLGSQLNEIVNEFAGKSKAKVERGVKKAVIKTFAEIIKTTPVGNPDLWKSKKKPIGYVGGRARNNWIIDSEVNRSIQLDPDKSKGSPYVTNNVKGKNIFKAPLYLYNNLPYINKLEYGSHSQQTPKGMVRLALLKWRKQLRKYIAQETR